MSSRRWRACPECDWVSALPVLRANEVACCPRCGRELAHRHSSAGQRVLAYGSSALAMLLLTLPFPFLAFTLAGNRQEIVLADAALAMFNNDWPLLALLIALAIIILPGIFLISVLYLYSSVIAQKRLDNRVFPGAMVLARNLSKMKPWLMTDVFLVGVLVSLAKLVGMAEIDYGWSFVAFCGYVVLLVKTVSLVDADWLWFALKGEPKPPLGIRTGATATEQQAVGCPCCGLINNDTQPTCMRCQTSLARPSPQRLQATWALLLTAVVLYVPANLYPMMETVSVGGTTYSTILGGVIQMIEMESYFVTLVIFVASFIVPIAKILVLSYLCWLAAHPQAQATQRRMRWYRYTELVGRWSMIDVFVVAIMVALIQAGVILSIYPGT